MRILKNIYNEFLVYYKRISTTEQDPNKLLSTIIYKNVFPRDFSDLQLNRGFVCALFNKKDEFIQEEISRLNDKITQINNAIATSENEHLKSVEEVNELFDPKIQILRRYGYGSSNDQVRELESQKVARIENIKNKTVESQNNLKRQISEVQVSASALQHKKLQEILNKQNATRNFKTTLINEID